MVEKSGGASFAGIGGTERSAKNKVSGAAPRRRRGGQPGNQNALKHGFYSPGFKPDEAVDLAELAGQVDLRDEIEMLRVVMPRMFEQVGACHDADDWAAATRLAGLLRT